MIKSILVAVDASPYSDAARAHAVALAKLYGARVVGVHVLDVRLLEMPPYLDYTYEGIPLTPMPLEILEGFRTKGDRALTLFREAAEAAGVPVDALMEEGVPADTIADLGDEHDLIVMGKRGEHARWGKDMLGSIAEGVARRATTPVLLTEEKPVEVRSLLVLFDGSHAAHRALKLGADVASHCGASVRVLTTGDDQAKAGAVQEEAHTVPRSVHATRDVAAGGGRGGDGNHGRPRRRTLRPGRHGDQGPLLLETSGDGERDGAAHA